MAVYTCDAPEAKGLADLIRKYGMGLTHVDDGLSIPGSHFGDPEAGLVGNQLLVRNDTPVHSAFHETCHYICMDQERREALHTNAGGDYDEENGVCYLQVLLAEQLPSYSSTQMMKDMDEWGYTFRLGSTQAWFHNDAEDAQAWLQKHRLINANNNPSWKLRINQ